MKTMQNEDYAMNIIKVQYIRDGKAQGAKYTYKSDFDIREESEIYVKARGKHLQVKVAQTINPSQTEAYDEALTEMSEKGFTMAKVTEIGNDDLEYTLNKKIERQKEQAILAAQEEEDAKQ